MHNAAYKNLFSVRFLLPFLVKSNPKHLESVTGGGDREDSKIHFRLLLLLLLCPLQQKFPPPLLPGVLFAGAGSAAGPFVGSEIPGNNLRFFFP